ncbi:MAG: HAD family phosphatase [Candidatus Woesearchaeota archaeon]
MIKAVLFDLGGVLVTDIVRVLEEFVSKTAGIPIDKVQLVRRDHWSNYELSKMSGIEFMQKEIDNAGMKMSPQELLERSYDMIEYYADSVDMVKRLKATGRYKLGVISNNTLEWARFEKDDMGLGQYFDVWISSADVNECKPMHSIYLLAAERLGIDPSDCVFIDDKQKCIAGAVEVGMVGIQFEDAKQLEAELKQLGLDF